MHPSHRSRHAGLFGAVALLLGAISCATLPRPTLPLGAVPVQGAAALDAAVDAFYAARTPAELREAVERAQALAPNAGKTHELVAELARLEMRQLDEFDARIAAAQDLSYDATVLQLHELEALPRDDARHARHLALLEALTTSHPEPSVRSAAAWFLAEHLHVLGDDAGRERAVREVTGVLPFSVVGGWDNDQGKGFEIAQAPEAGVDLGARYDGALMQIGWQTPPRDFRGEVALREFVAPDRWSVAYAATGFRVPQGGPVELRVGTTDPIKVWVDGTLVFEAREIDAAFAFDQFVIPLSLEQGDHQLLVKSAHRTGDWRLMARITGPSGAPLTIEPIPAGLPDSVTRTDQVLSGEAAVAERVKALTGGEVRRGMHHALWVERALGGSPLVRTAEAFARRLPDALLARYELVGALWRNDERGRTADELAKLDAAFGQELPLIRRQQARFWQYTRLRTRARDALLELVAAYPDRLPAARQLASLFDQERWNEDECRTLEALDREVPGVFEVRRDMAACWDEEGREDRAIALYRELLRIRPRQPTILSRLHTALRSRGELGEAADVARRLIAAWPERLWPRLWLAETLRRQGAIGEAREVLARAQQLFPNSADVYRARAHLAWREGKRDEAVAAWQAALARNPDDEATANRLDFVAPATVGPWAQDIPNEEAIARAVKARESLEPRPGADIAYLLDHEVTQLRGDGSTTNVVTLVVHALNQAGRDKLTRQRLQYSGRHRVLHAFSVDASGRRSEASVRSREVLYRGLDVGSTIVLQYRADAPPSGFLPRYLSKAWYFQSTNDQRNLAQFVLWYPAGTRLHEDVRGALERDEKRVGDEVRVSWSLRDVPPVVSEPSMPPLIDVAANLMISTVPGWEAYEAWEEALMEGVFHESPELDALAARLADGATTVEEKLLRIHDFVMAEIRYQQDYESFIAGVKPHPASMVVERRYGDCKDKTVLFMTLAKKLGIRTHFATIRTRDRGPVRRAVPTQQFNHAIVYVPPQEGFPEGRFFDATADALDLDVLRDDNVGTEAFVFDPETGTHTWIPVPWQTPDHHHVRTLIALQLAADGSAKGTLELAARGRTGSMVRRMTRNPEHFKQFMQMVAGAHFAGASAEGATAVEVEDLRQPATVRAAFSAPNAARREGNELRMRLPTEWPSAKAFNLAERRHDLVLGTPNTLSWTFDVTVPEGMKIGRVPSSGEIDSECLSLQRAVTPTATGVTVRQSLTIACERIPADQYPAYRAQVEQMNRFTDEELVLVPASAPVVKPARANQKKR